MNFLQRIKNFDKDNISNATLKKMEKYTKDANFTPPLVAKVSVAAGALCQWFHAMKIYAEIFREVEPKKLRLRIAQETLDASEVEETQNSQHSAQRDDACETKETQ